MTQNAVNVLVKTLEENRADIVSSCFVGEGDSVKDIKILCGKEALKASILDYPETYSACAKIYKKDILTDVSFSEGIRVHEDSFFLFNIFLKQPKMTVINEETYLYKNNAGSASRSGFSDKYLDILWVADQKIKKIQEFYPELYDIANNITVKANMALLFNLCNVKGKKDLSKNCIKAIKTNKKYFVAATKSDRKRFFIVKNNLFWLYKLYRNIKGKLFG